MVLPDISIRFDHFANYIHKVGDFLCQVHNQTSFDIQKKGIYDLVTEADIGSEKMVIEEILKNYPNDSILGEESGEVKGNSDYRWIIDPLDGTTNYSHKLPLYGVSIAIEEISSAQIVVGLVLFPELNDFYYAIRGEGSFKNRKRINVSDTAELKESLFSTGFPYNRAEKMDQLIAYYKNILLKTRGVRRTGAATLDLCWLAEGRFDGFWEVGLKPWDMAAACLIVEEAGGQLSTLDGQEYSPYIPSLIASNSRMHDRILQEFL